MLKTFFSEVTKSRTVRQLMFYYMKKFHCNCLKGQAVSGLIQFLATESPLKTMKNPFHVTSKTLFVLKIFKFLP